MQLDSVRAQERHEERVERERQTAVDVVREGDPLVVLRGWSGLCPGHAPHVFTLRAEKTLAFEGVEPCRRARGLGLAHGASLRRIGLLADGGSLPRGLLHHRKEAGCGWWSRELQEMVAHRRGRGEHLEQEEGDAEGIY